MRRNLTVIIFAKSANICRVKTRLWPTLNHRQCLNLHKTLVRKVIKPLEAWHKYRVVVYTTGHSHAYKLSHKLTIKQQYGPDLGTRMYYAMLQELRYSQRVILVGSDCVAVTRKYIEQASRLLYRNNDIVIGPTHDGGYCLIAARSACKSIFKNITWGSTDVFNQTISNAKRAHRHIHVLEPIHDIDTAEDLQFMNQTNEMRIS